MYNFKNKTYLMTTRIFFKEEQNGKYKKLLESKKMSYFKCVENCYFHKSRKSNHHKHVHLEGCFHCSILNTY